MVACYRIKAACKANILSLYYACMLLEMCLSGLWRKQMFQYLPGTGILHSGHLHSAGLIILFPPDGMLLHQGQETSENA